MATFLPATANGKVTSMQIGAEVTILKRDFEALIENEGDTKILIVPEPQEPEEKGVTITDLVTEFTNLYKSIDQNSPIDAGKLTESIKKVVNIDKLTLDLNMLFLYLFRNSDRTKKENDILEYAFKISLNNTDLDPTLKDLFVFKSAFFAIWNTGSKKIIEEMKLKSIADILDAYNQ
jgi:hypothetical protein